MSIVIKNNDNSIELLDNEPLTIYADGNELNTNTQDLLSIIRRNGYYLGYKDEPNVELPPQVAFAESKRKELFSVIESAINDFKNNLPDGVDIWLNATQPEHFLALSVDIGKNYE